MCRLVVRSFQRLVRTGVMAALALAPIVVAAQNVAPASRQPEVELQAEASREIANDLMQAVLFLEANDGDSARLAGTLNRAMNEALAAGRDFPSVQMRSGNLQTFPIYDRTNKLTGWRGRAEVRLEGREFRDMAALVARLQSTMQLGGISFGVSRELRRQTEDQLVGEAIAALKARGEIVRRALGGAGATIRRLTVGTGGEQPGPRVMAAVRPGVAGAPVVDAASFEGGTSRVVVTVSGIVAIE
jgi:predicted secreted protein